MLPLFQQPRWTITGLPQVRMSETGNGWAENYFLTQQTLFCMYRPRHRDREREPGINQWILLLPAQLLPVVHQAPLQLQLPVQQAHQPVLLRAPVALLVPAQAQVVQQHHKYERNNL